MATLQSSSINKLLDILSTHQKGVGGGGNQSAGLNFLQSLKQTVLDAAAKYQQAIQNVTGLKPNQDLTPQGAAGYITGTPTPNDPQGNKSLLSQMVQQGPPLIPEDIASNLPGLADTLTGTKMAVNDVTQGVSDANTALGQAGNVQLGTNEGAPLPPTEKAPVIYDSKGNPIPSSGASFGPKINMPSQEPPVTTQTGVLPDSNLNPTQETPSAKINPVTEKVPYPNVRPEPTEVTGRTGSNPITGGNPVRVDLRNQAGKNPYYLEDMNKSQAVLDKYVPGNTPIEVENNLPKSLTQETQRIQNLIGNDPQRVSMKNLITQNESNLQSKGFSPGLTPKGDTATQGLIEELNSQTGNTATLNPNTQLSGRDLIDYKAQLDSRLPTVYKKLDNGTSLTPSETATLTFRRTINSQLKDMYPKVGNALDRQSAMIDARESVANAAQDQEKGITQIANQPKSNPVMNILKGVVTHPWRDLGMLGLGGVAYTGYTAARVANEGGNGNFKPSVDQNGIPDPTQITDNQGNSLLMNQADYNQQKAAIATGLQANARESALGTPNGKAQDIKLQAADNLLEAKYAKSQDLLKQTIDTKNQVTGLTTAEQLLNSANPHWFQAIPGVGGYSTTVRALLDPQYGQFIQHLNTLHNIYGIDTSLITQAASPQDANRAISQTINDYKNKLFGTIRGQGGVVPGEKPQAKGKDVLNSQLNQILQPPASTPAPSPLNKVLSPAPSATPDLFQRLSTQSYQQMMNGGQ